MSSLYLKEGNSFFVTSDEKMDLYKTLPAATYVVSHHPMRGFYLETVSNMSLPPKMYGDANRYRDRIFTTFLDRTVSTGVLLSGEKGSGKTLLSKSLSILGIENDIPTILVNTAFSGDSFNKFIQGIQQRCIMIFDEFEKIFDKRQQQELLTLLDGTFNSTKMFILTCNDQYIDKNMMNRPGRLYYVIEYGGLDDAFITEYCQDCLENTNFINQIIIFSKMFYNFNFDMLKALVEEMNRYDENPVDAAKILNARPQDNFARDYKMKLIVNGEEKKIEYDDTWEGNPFSQQVSACYDPDPTDEDGDLITVEFDNHDITKLDVSGKVTYKSEDGTATLVLTRDYPVRKDISRLIM